MVTKYILHPGFVISASDRDRHFIGAGQLAQLYGVSLVECIVDDEAIRTQFRDSLIHLWPQHDREDYILESKP